MCLLGFCREGEGQGEGGALTNLTRDFDGAAEEFDEEFDEGEADAVAAGFAGAGFVDAVEAVEDAGEVIGGDADAVVLDGDGGGIVLLLGLDVDGAAIRGVFDGVFGQVVEDLPEELGRGEDAGQLTSARAILTADRDDEILFHSRFPLSKCKRFLFR